MVLNVSVNIFSLLFFLFDTLHPTSICPCYQTLPTLTAHLCLCPSLAASLSIDLSAPGSSLPLHFRFHSFLAILATCPSALTPLWSLLPSISSMSRAALLSRCLAWLQLVLRLVRASPACNMSVPYVIGKSFLDSPFLSFSRNFKFNYKFYH